MRFTALTLAATLLCLHTTIHAQVLLQPEIVIGETVGDPSIFGSVTFADFNSDGRPDLVTEWSQNGSPPEIRIYAGLGGGYLSDPVVLPLPSTAGPTAIRAFAAEDMNEDGATDLVVSESLIFDSRRLVYLGDAAFGFQLVTTLDDPGLSTSDLAVADFNEDGHLDVAVTGLTLSPTQPQVRVSFGDGAGGLTATPSPIVVPAYVQLDVGDVNGDTHLDLVLLDSDEGVVLLGQGTGTFTQLACFAAPASTINEIRLGDLDEDGQLDLVAAGEFPNLLATYRGLGDGTFAPYQSLAFSSVASPKTLLVRDFNNDGHLDVSVQLANSFILTPPPEHYKGRLEVYRGDGDGNLTLEYFQIETRRPFGAAAADLTGDGVLDIASACRQNPQTSSVCLYLSEEQATSSFRRGDVNADNAFDLGDVVASLGVTFGTTGSPSVCEDAADANDDGVLDLADPISLVCSLFQGCSLPPLPGPTQCGPDPTDDSLNCASFDLCPAP